MSNGKKFACLAVHAYPVVGLPPTPVDVGHGFSVSSSSPDVDPSDWSEDLGTFQIDQIKHANVWVWVEMESDQAEILDDENQRLQARLERYWWGLLLQEPPRIFSAWVFSGQVQESGYDLRSFTKFDDVFDQGLLRTKITLDLLREAAETARAYEKIMKGPGLTGRIHQGFAAFTDGVKSRCVDSAHLCFQRSLEGVFHPKNKNQFVKRGVRVFRDLSRDDNDATDLLTAIYDMRSGFTHCETLAIIFPDLEQAEAERTGISLRHATYTLAVRTYRAVFQDPELARRFGQEGQGEFWGKVTDGRRPPPFVIKLHPEDWLIEEKDA